jgi:type IV secretion system protein VirB1
MAAVMEVESGYNPYAIGIVGGRLARQPKNAEEAVATALQLEANGWNFSLGVAQVNRHNLPKYQINYAQAFDACTSVRVGSKILEECYVRALKITANPQSALHAAFSCYYSGNFTRGFKPDVVGKPSYVQKVLASAGFASKAIPVVPSLATGAGVKPRADNAVRTAGPVALVPQAIQLLSLPADHAPVLLRPSKGGDNLEKKQAVVTPAADGQAESVTKETPAEKSLPASSAIVF